MHRMFKESKGGGTFALFFDKYKVEKIKNISCIFFTKFFVCRKTVT
jgi:hypothetical protein